MPEDDSFDRCRYYFLDRIAALIERGSRVASAIDKTLISLSGGALIFSMTFVERLAPQKLLLPLLFCSWAFFALAIICVILAMREEQSALHAEAKQYTDSLAKLDQTPGAIRQALQLQPSITVGRNPKVWRWNLFPVGAFLVGVLLLGAFVGFNLWQSKGDSRLSHETVFTPLEIAFVLVLLDDAATFIVHADHRVM
jgi:hypothetical protein